MDGNEAVANVAYHLSEVVCIYPITPSSPMAEWADAWVAAGRKNYWGTIPSVIEMQSEGGAAGAVHGALQTGSLATTFTASQGLLLMIPNMYKIAGELTPAVFHIAARALATQGLSIFGDHSDVMAARQTGWAMLCSTSVQEAHDFALIAHAASLKCRIPFMHFFDGFRTSHEVAKIEMLPPSIYDALMDTDCVLAHRQRALSPDYPVLRGTAQNPDTYFQARETVNPFYTDCAAAVKEAMAKLGQGTGRHYEIYQYSGDPSAEQVIVIMGSGADTTEEVVGFLNQAGRKTGVLKVRLYRPFIQSDFISALPETVKAIAVLDRTKEPGAGGEPLYLDVTQAVYEAVTSETSPFQQWPKVIGGRYGIGSKEFTPAMVKAVFDNLAQPSPKNHFTVGINDDVTHTSLDVDDTFTLETEQLARALFFGLGSDGTVGANKNSIKIIGEFTDNHAQGYFVYDSKKSGAMTISHLRFGRDPIQSPYLISQANFIGCHQPNFVDSVEMLDQLVEGGTFLLNTPHPADLIWSKLPTRFQRQLQDKKARFYVIDANKVAYQVGMGGRINTIMQVCFFGISNVIPREEAINAIKETIHKTYGKKGEEIVNMNLNAVDQALEHLHEVTVPTKLNGQPDLMRIPKEAPEFVRNVLGEMMMGRGDRLPVSVLPCDGTYPTHTARWEKRNLAFEIPVWDPEVCIQCGKCTFICPHGVIRSKVYEPEQLKDAPEHFLSIDARYPAWKGKQYTLQVAVEDCTGCGICVDVCPARNKKEAKLKAIDMQPQAPLRDQERVNWDFFLKIPELDRRTHKVSAVREQQVLQPLFEFSGACAGCGETPYVKLVSQLFGDRLLVANATGCSSIYGGNLPTTPWATNSEGRGPAWSNSLFEDNAEFGLGYRVSLDKQIEFASELLKDHASLVGDNIVQAILDADQSDESGIYDQRERVAGLKLKLADQNSMSARQLLQLADVLVKKSVWIIGGDGWAYDIGFGGLDHVFASGRNVNILVLDTEVYSNTGGQMSKSTPRSAVAKFATGGKPSRKKDLGLIAMTYGGVYVASVAMGAKDEHTLKAFLEAEAYPGVSLIIAYSHCVAHGIRMSTAMQNQKAAVNSGQWLLYRYHPDRTAKGENPLSLDSSVPRLKVEEYLAMENRFKMLTKSRPDLAKHFHKQAQQDVEERWKHYQYMAAQSNP